MSDPLSKQKERVLRDFDRKAAAWASRYDSSRDFRTYNFHSRRRTVVELMRSVEGLLLDIGCGTGDFLPVALEESGRVLGLEVSSEMARHCRTRFQEDVRDGHLLIAEGDIESLCLPEGSVQAALCVGVIEYLLRPDAALRELSRVLAPGGYLIITVPNAASPFVAADRTSKAIRRAGSRLYRRLRGRPTDDGSYRHGYFTPWGLDGRLREAGLRVDRRAWSTFGSFMYSNYIPFSVKLSELMNPLRHRPMGLIAANYIVRAVKPGGLDVRY